MGGWTCVWEATPAAGAAAAAHAARVGTEPGSSASWLCGAELEARAGR